MNDYFDARQHLNLSELAYEVLDGDRYEFLEKPSFARIVNMVLASYMEDAAASIENALLRYRSSLEEALAPVPDDETKEAAVSALVERHRGELLAAATGYPREKAFKVRLDKDNFLAMQQWHDENGYYSGMPSRFLKAVIEEYARKPLYEREGILLRERIDELNAYVRSQQLIVVTLKGTVKAALKCVHIPLSMIRDSTIIIWWDIPGSSAQTGRRRPRPSASRGSRTFALPMPAAER